MYYLRVATTLLICIISVPFYGMCQCIFTSANNILCVAYLITKILPVVLYGCENWSLKSGDQCRLRVLQYRVLRRIFVFKREKV